MEDLTAILEALIGSNQEVKVVLWARGMASSIAVEYVTQQQQEMTKWQRTAPARRMIRRDRILQSRKEHQAEHQRSGTECTEGDEEDEDEEEGPRQYVKFLVLDSPFTSLKEVVLEAAQQIDLLGTVCESMLLLYLLNYLIEGLVGALIGPRLQCRCQLLLYC